MLVATIFLLALILSLIYGAGAPAHSHLDLDY